MNLRKSRGLVIIRTNWENFGHWKITSSIKSLGCALLSTLLPLNSMQIAIAIVSYYQIQISSLSVESQCQSRIQRIDGWWEICSCHFCVPGFSRSRAKNGLIERRGELLNEIVWLKGRCWQNWMARRWVLRETYAICDATIVLDSPNKWRGKGDFRCLGWKDNGAHIYLLFSVNLIETSE